MEAEQLFKNDRMQINAPINVSALYSELDTVQGVQSVATISIKNITESGYSNNVYDMQVAFKNGTLYPSLDPMIFELKFPNTDIEGRIVQN